MEVEVKAGAPEAPEEFAKRRDTAIETWLNAKNVLASWKGFEAEGRQYVAQMLFPTPTRGTQYYPLPDGRKVKLVYGLNYTLGNKEMVNPLDPSEKVPVERQVEDLQEAICQLGNEGPLLAERLIKWKPELNESEYRKLNPELEIEAKIKEMIDAILIVKSAAPTLEVVEPKK